MSVNSGTHCFTDLLVDLSQPASPKRTIVDDDDEFLSTIPNIVPDSVFSGINDVSYSTEHCTNLKEHHHRESKDDMKEESDSPSLLLDDEQFDFDLSNLASDNESEHNSINTRETGADEDEDEIFFGPVGHTEKCVAVAVSEVAKVIEKQRPLGPLTAAEMAELCREACTIASRIEIAAGGNAHASSKENREASYEPSGPVAELNSGAINNHSGSSNVEKKIPANCFEVQVMALPTSELPRDLNGVVKFAAAGQLLSKPSKSAFQKRVAGSIGLARPAPVKPSLNHLPSKGNSDTLVKGVGLGVQETSEVEVPLVRVELSKKRHCISSTSIESIDAASDTASIASDTSEASCVNPSTGKRSLPQPKFVRNVPPSKLPQIGVFRALPASQNASQSVQPSAAVVAAPSLQRVGSLRLKEPSTRLPTPGGLQQSRLAQVSTVVSDFERSSTAATSSSIAASVDDKVSGLRPPAKPDMLATTVPGLDKRKTLTAIRGLNLVSGGQKQGPLKAVLPGANTSTRTGFDQNNSATTGSAPSVSRGVNVPVATSTPCKPVRPDGKLNSSLCTPSRSSSMKPPTPSGSTVKRRASCIITPGRVNSSLNISRNDMSVSHQAGIPGRDSGVQRRSAADVRQSPSVVRAPASKENVSVMRQPGLTLSTRDKTDDLQANRKTAMLKLSNNF